MGSDEESYEILQQVLDSSVDDIEEEIVRDYISNKAIETLEFNVKFFRDIPKSDLVEILRELISLIHSNEYHNYNLDPFPELREAYEEKHPNYNKRNPKVRPTIQLGKDIKTIKEFKETFKRLFNVDPHNKGKDKWFPILIFKDDDPFKKELHKFYKGIKKLLNDLEKEEFKIISKSNYYQTNLKSKKNIEDFLKDIKNKYELKGISLELKQIKDSLPNII